MMPPPPWRPFRVYYSSVFQEWELERKAYRNMPAQRQLGFKTAGDAIDYAHKHWPWWL